VSELGNLMAGILLSLWRMSTVKIRARSLFCTTVSRSRAGGAGFGLGGYVENGKRLLARNNRGDGFPLFSTAPGGSAQLVHKYP